MKERSLSKLSEQFAALRARIESEVATPASILVTSARPGDGKTATAACLASNLATAGYRVLLVDASRSARLEHVVGPRRLLATKPEEVLEFVRSRAEGGEDVLNLTNSELAESLSTDVIRSIIPILKENYDYVLIDSAEYLTSTPALLFGSSVDGVLLTVRKGRSASAEDGELSKALDASRANVLGIVSVAAKAARDVCAAQLGESEYGVRIVDTRLPDRLPARPTSSVAHTG